jgi:flagellar biosynthesis/type III secretory pathway protein FliH
MNAACRVMLQIVGFLILIQTAPTWAQIEDYHGGPLNARQHGYQHGYQDGYESGRPSRLSNRDQDIRNQRLKAQGNGYQSSFGSEVEYSEGYREGFNAGSSDVANGVRSRLEELFRWQDPNFNPDRPHVDASDGIYRDNHWSPEHVAGDIGYRDGVNAGVQDRTQRRPYNPRRRAAWKNAIHGYDAAQGSQTSYKKTYRDSYERGYQDGFGSTR